MKKEEFRKTFEQFASKEINNPIILVAKNEGVELTQEQKEQITESRAEWVKSLISDKKIDEKINEKVNYYTRRIAEDVDGFIKYKLKAENYLRKYMRGFTKEENVFEMETSQDQSKNYTTYEDYSQLESIICDDACKNFMSLQRQVNKANRSSFLSKIGDMIKFRRKKSQENEIEQSQKQ